MANSDDLLRMEDEILQRLYEPFFLSFDGANLRDLPKEQGFDRSHSTTCLVECRRGI